MIDRPQEIAYMVGIISLIAVVASIGLQDVLTARTVEGESTTGFNSSYFSVIVGNATASSGLKGASDDSGSALSGGVGSQENEEGFIVRGSSALLKLGKTMAAFGNAVTSSVNALNIPTEMMVIIMALLAIAFAVSIYVFWRGGTQ